ncbi:MAG: nucleoside hydrolase [Proteobacteria bacterium]|nr:nucleoside hydrolase [Pseudomonadota bacterium]
MEKTKIIIDTDIGDDIDDALAISFALNCPEIEIVGITTVFKNTELRAKMTKKLLQLHGRDDIPVYAGCSQPLMMTVDRHEIPIQHFDELNDVAYETDMDGVDYIIETVMKSDGDIVLAGIGPLTNIAMALVKNPEIKEKIKEIVWMGGAFYFHFVTWNSIWDPEAVKIVFESGVPVTAVGRDVCQRIVLKPDKVERICSHDHPINRFMATLFEGWRKRFDIGVDLEQLKPYMNPIVYDALALYGVFGRDFLKFRREKVVVETKGEFTRGFTLLCDRTYPFWGKGIIDPLLADKPPIQVAYEVDVEGFIDFFMKRMLN